MVWLGCILFHLEWVFDRVSPPNQAFGRRIPSGANLVRVPPAVGTPTRPVARFHSLLFDGCFCSCCCCGLLGQHRRVRNFIAKINARFPPLLYNIGRFQNLVVRTSKLMCRVFDGFVANNKRCARVPSGLLPSSVVRRRFSASFSPYTLPNLFPPRWCKSCPLPQGVRSTAGPSAETPP